MLWYTCLIKHAETLLRTKDCCTHSNVTSFVTDWGNQLEVLGVPHSLQFITFRFTGKHFRLYLNRKFAAFNAENLHHNIEWELRLQTMKKAAISGRITKVFWTTLGCGLIVSFVHLNSGRMHMFYVPHLIHSILEKSINFAAILSTLHTI
jgi:hypothetical protein